MVENVAMGWILLAIMIAGALGGLINALLSDNGFVLPKREEAADKASIIRPGVFGNVLIGATSAAISWGLYGPAADAVLISSQEAGAAASVRLTFAAFAGAILVGAGGARWLTNELDKKVLKLAASEAAAGDKDEAKAKAVLAAPNALEALRAVRSVR